MNEDLFRQIVVGPTQDSSSAVEAGAAAVVDSIRVGDEIIQHALEQIKVGETVMTVDVTNLDGEESMVEREVSEHVSVEGNVGAADFFCQVLRARAHELLSENNGNPALSSPEEYDQADFSSLDLFALAKRWQLPIMLIRLTSPPIPGVKETSHWELALKPPEAHGGGYRVLVYDPMLNAERWRQLDDYQGMEQGVSSGVYVDEVGYRAIESGNYDYSLTGDEEIAAQDEVALAKQARVQFDAINCGPMCLFAAALREGMKPEWTAFEFAGKEQLRKDTGLEISNRAQVLG